MKMLHYTFSTLVSDIYIILVPPGRAASTVVQLTVGSTHILTGGDSTEIFLTLHCWLVSGTFTDWWSWAGGNRNTEQWCSYNGSKVAHEPPENLCTCTDLAAVLDVQE